MIEPQTRRGVGVGGEVPASHNLHLPVCLRHSQSVSQPGSVIIKTQHWQGLNSFCQIDRDEKYLIVADVMSVSQSGPVVLVQRAILTADQTGLPTHHLSEVQLIYCKK